MKTKEILTIIGLIFLGLCFLCGLAKMGMKDAKRKGNCDKACGAFVFLGVALIAVSSVLKSSGSSGSTPTGLIPAGEEGGPCKQLSAKLRICGSGLFCNNQNRCQKLPYVPGISPAPAPAPAPTPPGTLGGACRTAGSLTQCIENSKVGPLVCQGGICVPAGMPGPVIPAPTPAPAPTPPGTLGGACRTAGSLTQCIENPKVGPLVCQGGICVPAGMPGPVIPGKK